jgi:hypothetical protein
MYAAEVVLCSYIDRCERGAHPWMEAIVDSNQLPRSRRPLVPKHERRPQQPDDRVENTDKQQHYAEPRSDLAG